MIASIKRILAILALALASTNSSATQLLVPAYFYPSFDPTQNPWVSMQAALTQVDITAIMNPDNGPGTIANSDYLTAVGSFQGAGGRVLGYVYTCYGNNNCVAGLPSQRSVADVMADVDRYASFYPTINGIFLDEMSNRADALSFYQQVSSAIRAAHPGWQIIGNAGAATPASYLGVADSIVTFEQGSASYATATTEPWMQSSEPLRQAHLHYNVSDAATMHNLLDQAISRNAGYVYFTDDTLNNPFDRLPNYWQEEVSAIASSVPEPSTATLLAAGLLLLTYVARRRTTRTGGGRATRQLLPNC